MKAQELRHKYLEFFRSRGHTIIPSAPLVPANDPTVLFTTAGMHPLVPYLLGQAHPGGKRLVNVQKCIRTGDIEEVGDDTHVTFIEMLGNWSLGDYFKQEAIEWSWEFLTDKKWLGLEPNRLAVSVFAGDDNASRDLEAAQIWINIGVNPDRVGFLPADKNWWGPAGQSGPCGPDTEMHYWIDAGTEAPENYQATATDPRWVEIWNDVFMQYNKRPDGVYENLSQKNVDTGMGLDRMLAVLGGHSNVYDTELFKPMFDVLALSQEVMSNDEVRRARIVLDHARAATFIVADGVAPSNKDRGYVLRRLLRRSMVYARLLGLKPHWLKALVGQVIQIYDNAYPELVERSESIINIIQAEQDKFEKTLERGLKEFEKLMRNNSSHPPLKLSGGAEGGGVITGKDAFDLYQTYGFPWELTRELAEAVDQKLDRKEFEESFQKHQELSRTASAGVFKGGLADHTADVVRLHTATHLMNAALRKVLGEQVWQKGSNITKERTRFDFTHGKKMTPEEIGQVEDLVNDWIGRDLSVKKEILPLQQAKGFGAIGVFGERYPDTVSIYTVYDPKTEEAISREFCGGPHVEHTGVIGKFKITKEEAISAGIRRIKAVVS